MKHPPRKSEQAMIKIINAQGKRHGKLVVDRKFVSAAAPDKVAKRWVITNLLDINYL